MSDRLKNMQLKLKADEFFWNDINPKVLEAQYAVRGVVPTLANQMAIEIQNGSKKYPFDSVTFCNLGNPQLFRQKPITFNRQVLSCLLNPELIKSKSVNADAAKRASSYLKEMISAGSYTHSLGVPFLRKSISKFISKNDNVPAPSIDNIFLTEGASQGVQIIINSLITNKQDAIMIPIPQYPLYTAAIALHGGSPAPYYLNEEKGWQFQAQQLGRAYNEASKQGKRVKAIVVINPGNPTGAIFTKSTISEIIGFAVQHRLIIIADEVYRQNIYKQNTKFISFREVLNGMSEQIASTCELVSLHSVSKGLLGECGLRGGYMYLHNFNPKVYAQLVKLKSINLCSNSIGQCMVELMCNPPLQNVSQNTCKLYLKQRQQLLSSMKRRAKRTTEVLNSMKNIRCNEVQGAMYAFPSIKFSKKAIEAAGKASPDLFYCLEVLKNTGIALVPGSGFRQKPGTYHFRITILILPESLFEIKLNELKVFNEQFHARYD